ncbi:MAG TPA: histidine--tRNA ligase [Bacteroidales bacterium]|nr:histidine--tRNA ligase [Bacteroidales bacterium]HPS16250.1 histidine--tRNA ligase [Bacteroidales bacterium]
MSSQKPSIPKGTRDFGVKEMIRRNYIFDTIRSVFRLYGYKPIETPAMENLSVLLGKYGEEGDRLIFKILNSGDYLSEIPGDKKLDITSNEAIKFISEKALRYDLTVPFARFVVMHQNEITFPFKRYQMQPVWRADRPQKGRYREFYQCDVDVIGSDSLLNEVELIQIVDSIFGKLKIPVKIKINNRKILSGIAEIIGESKRIVDITVAIDKLDKIGVDGVNKELQEKGISKDSLMKLQPIIFLKGNSEFKLNELKKILQSSEVGLKGISECETVLNYLKTVSVSSEVEFEITLARGLNYYTGAIFEVSAKDVAMGSIAGGGRYDDLTGIFGLPNVSGVGISFGADRIYDVLNEMNLFPEEVSSTTKILFINFGAEEEKFCLPLIRQVREAGVSAELYPSSAKTKKQFDYANANNIPFVAIVGTDEMKENSVSIKNMKTGVQEKISVNDLINKISNL